MCFLSTAPATAPPSPVRQENETDRPKLIRLRNGAVLLLITVASRAGGCIGWSFSHDVEDGGSVVGRSSGVDEIEV